MICIDKQEKRERRGGGGRARPITGKSRFVCAGSTSKKPNPPIERNDWASEREEKKKEEELIDPNDIELHNGGKEEEGSCNFSFLPSEKTLFFNGLPRRYCMLLVRGEILFCLFSVPFPMTVFPLFRILIGDQKRGEGGEDSYCIACGKRREFDGIIDGPASR